MPKGEGLGGGDSVDHPNRYFDASRKAIREAKDKFKTEDGDAEGAGAGPGAEHDEQKPTAPPRRTAQPTIQQKQREATAAAMDIDG